MVRPVVKSLALALCLVAPATAWAERLDLTGRSYGGKVRAGPGISDPQIGSTGLNTPIVLIERAAHMDGYDWFLIRLPDGRTGYQWGGLMCADGEISGVLTICGSPQDAELSGLPAAPDPPGKSPGRASQIPVLEYTCNEGIPLIVRFGQEGSDNVAYVSHDSFPEIRLPQTAGAGVLIYEDPPNKLIVAGTTAIVEFDGIVDECTEVN